jgi:hypothetical protein
MSSPIKFIDARPYHKSNYDEAVKYLIPKFYFDQDDELAKKEIDILDQVINTHLKIIENMGSVISIDPVEDTEISSIDTPEGISQFFIKQNNLLDLDLNDFEKKLLLPLNKSLKDFRTKEQFSDYIEYTFLPGTRLNSPDLQFDGIQPSANHIYLINNLSWLYFLNIAEDTYPPGGIFLDYNPSAYVKDLLVEKLYMAQPISLNDGIKGLTTYIWKNYNSQAYECSTWSSLGLLPENYTPNVADQEDIYTSGSLQLDKLNTLVDVLYSPMNIDNGDSRVKNAIEDYLQNSYYLTKASNFGPFKRLIKGFSFAFADYSDKVDNLEILNDINRCPDEYLPLLADLIGWRLFGSDPDRWRLQISNAVNIYRTTGTKKSIQFAVDAVLGQEVFDISSNVSELWESYIPNLVYYSLATESSMLKNFSTWNLEKATAMGVNAFNPSSMDENIKLCVDKLMYDVFRSFPNQFFLGSEPFPIDSSSFIFNYRSRDYQIPPFEEFPYYLNVKVTPLLLEFLIDKLACFGVPSEFCIKVLEYMNDKIYFNASSDFYPRKGMLIFTDSPQYPPNWESVISDAVNDKSKYLPLWNGKSSHFKVLIEASSFDFTKMSLEADSREALLIASRIAQQFSPAHSIPNVGAIISDSDSYEFDESINNSRIRFERVESAELKTSSTGGFARYATSAIAMGTFKRGLTATSVASFSREDVNSIQKSLMSPDSTVAGSLPRRTHRRRNLKNIIPKDGYYDRTGFNMPTPLIDTYSVDQKFYPLGLVCSSLQYVPIPDYNNIPAIYDKCENLNSSSIYFGVAVSSTYPIRGWARNSN